jgi:hypothetical protein
MLSAALSPGDRPICKLATSYDKKKIVRACELSRLAYMAPEEVRFERLPDDVCDAPTFYDGNRAFMQRNSKAYAWRFDEDRQLWVAFRGTTCISTLIDDATCGRTRITLPNHPEFDEVYIHTGFVEHLSSIQSNLETDILRTISSRTSIRDIFFVGHSLGGATAQIAALYMGSLLKGVSLDIRVSCIGFGSPRISCGDQASAAFKECVHENVRVINEDDIVPMLPPRSFGYKHHGKALWMQDSVTYSLSKGCVCHSHNDTARIQQLRPLKAIHDHNMSNYLANVNKCMT